MSEGLGKRDQKTKKYSFLFFEPPADHSRPSVLLTTVTNEFLEEYAGPTCGTILRSAEVENHFFSSSDTAPRGAGIPWYGLRGQIFGGAADFPVKVPKSAGLGAESGTFGTGLFRFFSSTPHFARTALFLAPTPQDRYIALVYPF